MMHQLDLLAFDYGAASGRAILGSLRDGKLTLRTVHRFPNGPVVIEGHLHWDFPMLLGELKRGLALGCQASSAGLASVGIDTWGVDYGLIDANGELLGNPYHYRDCRTEGVAGQASTAVSRRHIYEMTGIAFLPFNTVYQLLAAKAHAPQVLERAGAMLMMPDLLGYFLTGQKATEYTNATTTQLIDPKGRDWCRQLMRELELPERIFTELQQPGHFRGSLKADIAQELGIGRLRVAVVASHDTASAVVAVPLADENAAYLSAGTWSLLGVETRQPVITPQTRRWNFTNEGGTDGRCRLLRNIAGMWLVQECKAAWDAQGRPLDYAELTEMAAACEGCGSFIDPDADAFAAPGDMPGKIARYCNATGQRQPDGVAQTARCVFESLALKYRWTIDHLEAVLGRRISCLHVVGGGSRNSLLNRFIASAIDRPVVCGPVEATAVGNLMMQARAVGAVGSLAEIRQVVARSFPVVRLEPENAAWWDAAYGSFTEMMDHANTSTSGEEEAANE